MSRASRAFHRGGPRKLLHFDPSAVNAAIVTCGGISPGLNNVIRELVHSLTNLYGAKKVWGITGGYQGFHNPDYAPILLTNESVEVSFMPLNVKASFTHAILEYPSFGRDGVAHIPRRFR